MWIEIRETLNRLFGIKVTPLAGVWIEIGIDQVIEQSWDSHSPCGSVD